MEERSEEEHVSDCCRRRTLLEICLIYILMVLIVGFLIWLMSLMNIVEECETSDCIKAARKFTEYVDETVDPCDNFYNFICGNFIKSYAEENFVSSPLDEQRQRINAEINEIITEPLDDKDCNSLRVAKVLYRSCLDLEMIDQDNDAAILDLLEQLGGWPVIKNSSWDEQNFNWVDIMLRSRQLGLKYDYLLSIALDFNSGPLVIPKISYPNLERIDENSRNYYLHLMVDVAVHFGANRSEALAEMHQVVEFENLLFQLIEDLPDSGDFTEEFLYQIQNKWVDINWIKLINNITSTKKVIADEFLVRNGIDYYLVELEKLLDQTPKRIQANYLVWKIMWEFGPFFSQKLRSKFEIMDIIENNKATSRSKFCSNFIQTKLSRALESEYVRRYAKEPLVKEVKEMLLLLQSTMVRKITQSIWMDQETKTNARNKIYSMFSVIGGPQEMYNARNYDEFLGLNTFEFESTNIVKMITQLQKAQYKNEFVKMYEINDRLFERFLLNWASINGRFLISPNIIMITTPVLHDDFYTPLRPQYLNYGGLGSIISHELSHSVDNNIIHYFDINSQRLIPWISVDAQEKYDEKLNCIAEDYGRYSDATAYPVNSSGFENFADFIGINIAYKAYQIFMADYGPDLTLPGLKYTPNQLFWMQAASFSCHRGRSDLDKEEKVETSSRSYKVNGAFKHSKYFSRDFHCPVNSMMNPEHKCKIL